LLLINRLEFRLKLSRWY